jgi:hypothetical protein
MTDFFTSLVDRALDRTPVLERRQPAFFEPLTESAAAFAEKASVGTISPLQENEIVVESTHSSSPHVIDNVSPVAHVSSRREETKLPPVEPQPLHPQSSHVSSNRQSERDNSILEPISHASIKEPAKAIRVNEAGTESRPSSVTKPQEITVAPLRTIETIVERRVEREIVTEHAIGKPAIKEDQTFARPAPQLKTNDVRDRAAEQKQSSKAEVKSPKPSKEQTTIKPSTEKKSVARQDSVPNVRAVPRVESRQARKRPASPPSVHVTIGRIEVRATPAPTGKSRVAQAVGPKTTLDDYLRSRGEGN